MLDYKSMLNTLDRLNNRGSKIYQSLLDEVLDPFLNVSDSKVFGFEEKDDEYFVNLEMAGVEKKQCKKFLSCVYDLDPSHAQIEVV